MNLSPQTQSLIVTYLKAVSAATGEASTILAGTGTAAQKSAAITSLFAGVAKGLNLPPGVPTEIVTIIQAVSNAVVSFLRTSLSRMP